MCRMFNFTININPQNVKQIQEHMNMLSYLMVFIKKTHSRRAVPLILSWEIYEFFKIAEVAAQS